MTIYVTDNFSVGILNKDETLLFVALTPEQAATVLASGFVSIIRDQRTADILGASVGMRITADRRYIVFDGYFDMLILGHYHNGTSELPSKVAGELPSELPTKPNVSWWMVKRPRFL